MSPARNALAALKAGNLRFLEGARPRALDAVAARREALAAGQAPSAVVLGCSDSRVPPEIVFDQELGELFVIRVAGNIANPTQLGSVEFAVHALGVRLVVVLGHSGCGAVRAAVEEALGGAPSPWQGLESIIHSIVPAIQDMVDRGREPGPELVEELMLPSVEANVRQAVRRLRAGLEADAPADSGEGLMVVGAVYEVETGTVRFLEDLPGTGDQ